MICQCGYVGEMSWSTKVLLVIFFKLALLKRQLSFSIHFLMHHTLHVERHAIVLHICALHYDSDMIYISSPQPCVKGSYLLGQGNGNT